MSVQSSVHNGRPALGARVSASDSLVRVTDYTRNGDWRQLMKLWIRAGERPALKSQPVNGIYIGYRTYTDGERIYAGDGVYGFHPHERKEVWLVVPSERQKPVPVLPEDVVLS